MKIDPTFVFSTNFSDPLLLKESLFHGVVEAVLLSEKYTIPSTLKRIEYAKASGCLIISDNGNFTRMSSIAQRFASAGLAIQKKAKALVNDKKNVSEEVLLERKLLIDQVKRACAEEGAKLDLVNIISRQLECQPHYLIGLEEFTIPVLAITGLLHPVFKPKAQSIKSFQRATAKLYLAQKNGRYGHRAELQKIRKYLVLHSYDYTSARQGAMLFNGIDEEGVAISFGGPMASREYIEQIKIRGGVERFGTLLPEPYLIATSILVGVTTGLANKSLPIHILGLGSPILIVLLGYLLRKNSQVSLDATSSYKDADDGTIYGGKNGFLKMDMFKVAAYALIDNQPYTSSSPYFQDFEKAFPSDWSTLRDKLAISSASQATQVAALLQSNPALLEQHIPYFTPMRGGADSFIKAVRTARAGGNYWVLKTICAEIRARKHDESNLKEWVFNELKLYEKNAGKKWGQAVKAIVNIIEKHKL